MNAPTVDWLRARESLAKLSANPWGLTPRECEVMDTLLKVHNNKATASAMGLSTRTVEQFLKRIRGRMGGQFNDRLGYILRWDRFRREGVVS